MKAYRQGQFDGLCGLYAVLNACQQQVHVRGLERITEDIHEELFKVGARAIPSSRFPNVLWEGMAIGGLLKVAKAVAGELAGEAGLEIKVWRPFRKHTFTNNKEFFDAVDGLRTGSQTSVIIGLEMPRNGHWTVLDRVASHDVTLLDSSGTKKLSRKGMSLAPAANKNRICVEETVAFRLVRIDGEDVYV